VVGKVTIAKDIGIHILYMGIISFLLMKKGWLKEEK
jgi:hypothetical protein